MKKFFYIFFLFSICLNAQLKTSIVGISLIKHFEGFRAKAYLCPASVPTIGYGSTRNVHLGMVITERQAEQLLKEDLVRFENYVNGIAERLLRQHEFDALSSFTFNVGYRLNGDLRSSINEGNTRLTVMRIMQYNRARVNGVLTVLSGLTMRRKAETSLYRNSIPNFISAIY